MVKLSALVCPMDWGLGHASRCVPVIRAFKNAGFSVVAAASGPGAELIKKEFGISGSSNQWLRVIPFPGFTVSYARSYLFLKLLLQLPLFLHHIRREKRVIRILAERYRPDIIVSDNRYGLAHGSVKSVIITHQLRPSMPYLLKFLEGAVACFIRHKINAFDECWIPDYPENSAGGRLIDGWEKLPGAFFIGWLTRFKRDDRVTGRSGGALSGSSRYRLMVILSGPEPQRSVLEEMFIDQLKNTGMKALLVKGLPFLPCVREKKGELEIISYMDSASLARAAEESELIVCRSGYSSVMDLLVTGKRAVLIPTPGQTEQEYLGRWLAVKGWFRVVRQKDMGGGGLAEVLRDVESDRQGQHVYLKLYKTGGDLLQERVNRLVRELAASGKYSAMSG